MKSIKTFLITFLIIAMTLSSTLTAFASNTQVIFSKDHSAWLSENITGMNLGSGEIVGTESWIKSYLTAAEDKAAKEDGEPISLGTWSRGDISGEFYLQKGKTLESLSKKINQSMNGDKVADRVLEMIENLEMHASTGDATALFSGFMPLINLLLGVMVTLITVGMTFFSAMDIAYIAFPFFRNMCEDKKMTGGPGTRKTSTGETRVIWVTDDAVYAVKQGSIDSGQSPWAIYFRKRIMSYIMLAIILFILMTGNISLITNLALKAVEGVMNVLEGLAA